MRGRRIELDPPRLRRDRMPGCPRMWRLWLGHDRYGRRALTVVAPGLRAVTVWWVWPSPKHWRRFPPWRWRRTWFGWVTRRPLSAKTLRDLDDL